MLLSPHIGLHHTKNEHDTAFNILQDEDDFTVIGWKVARKLLTWVSYARNWSMMNESDVIHEEEEDNEEEMEEDEKDEVKEEEKEEVQ